MKNFVFLVLSCSFTVLYSQTKTIKIHLYSSKDSASYLSDTKKEFNAYFLRNKSDSVYIWAGFRIGGDMGQYYLIPNYNYIDSIEDGIYEVWIDSVLIEKLQFKNHKKHGFQVKFFKTLIFIEEFNLNDRKAYIVLDSTMSFVKEFLSESLPRISYKYNFNKLVAIDYFEDDGSFIVSDYIEKNKIVKSDCSSNYFCAYKYIPKVKIKRKGIQIGETLNGAMEYKLNKEHFKLKFKNGAVVNWSCIDKNGKILNSEERSSEEIQNYYFKAIVDFIKH